MGREMGSHQTRPYTAGRRHGPQHTAAQGDSACAGQDTRQPSVEGRRKSPQTVRWNLVGLEKRRPIEQIDPNRRKGSLSIHC